MNDRKRSTARCSLATDQPLVSILTPTFQHGRYLRDCIESVRGQTYPHWELLVREDGDPDPSLVVDDARVRYGGQPHRSVWRLAETYNELLASARGELVAVLEGDDAWPRDKLERQVEIHRRNPDVVLSFGRALRVDADGRGLSTWDLVDVPIERPFDALERLLFGCPIPAVTAVIRRAALEQVGGFSQPAEIPATDYPTWLELARLGPFYASGDILGHWRVHARNVSTEHVLALTRGGRDVALTHRPPGVPFRAVAGRWHDIEADVLASIGRAALARRDWPGARRAFAGALRRRAGRPAPLGAAKALAGLALALAHVSVAADARGASGDELAP